ncbi:hypothetical protein [Pedobacter sp.]
MKTIFYGITIFLASNTFAQNIERSSFDVENAQRVVATKNGTDYIIYEKQELTAIDVVRNSKEVNIAVDTSAVLLYQNTPNPFKDHAIIRFYVHPNIRKAGLNLYDTYGKLVEKWILNERGHGQVELPALSPGKYTYSIQIDGFNVASRSLEKQ